MAQSSPEEYFYCPDPGSWQIMSVCYLDTSIHLGKPETVYNSLYPSIANIKFRAAPDPSLQWLIDACMSKKQSAPSQAFRNSIHYKPVWNKEVSVPEVYSFKIHKDTLNAFITNYSAFSIWNSEPDSVLQKKDKFIEGWINYYAHNHKELKTSLKDSATDAEVLTTNHGVVVKKVDLYSWVFVTDGIITGGPEKLRWRSIEKTLIYKDHVFILLNIGIPSYERMIYMVDYKNGICKAINDQVFFPDDNPLFDFSISGNKLTLIRSGHSTSSFIYKDILIKDLLQKF